MERSAENTDSEIVSVFTVEGTVVSELGHDFTCAKLRVLSWRVLPTANR